MVGKHQNENPGAVFAPYQQIFNTLVNRSVSRVALEPWSVRLVFDGFAQLHVEGEWRLKDDAGHLLDENQDIAQRQQFQLWRLVGQDVTGFRFADLPFPTFVMKVSSGWELEVIADDDKYEDWSLVSTKQPGFWVVCMGIPTLI